CGGGRAAVCGRASVPGASRAAGPALRGGAPGVGGFVAGLFGILAARRAGGHGVAEILEAVALGRGRISVATNLWKAAGPPSAIAPRGAGRPGGPAPPSAGAPPAGKIGHPAPRGPR